MNYKNEKYPVDIRELNEEIYREILLLDKSLAERAFKISDFFTITDNKKKVNQDIVKINVNNKNEIKGLYIFSVQQDNMLKPLYVGISQTIIRRLKQHFFGEYHNQSTLVYIQSKEKYKIKNQREFTDKRDNFPYDDYRDEIQQFMREHYYINVVPINDNFKLSLMEINCACFWHTKYNTFETH